MWREFIHHFLSVTLAFGLLFFIGGRKRFGWPFWWMAVSFALSLSVYYVIFKLYPDLDRGLLRYAVVAGITLAISLPLYLLVDLILKRRQKRNHDA